MRRALLPVAILAIAGPAVGLVSAIARTARPRAAWQPDVRAAEHYARGRAGQISFAVKGLDGRLKAFEFDPSHAYGEHTLEGVARRLLEHLPKPSRRS